MSVYPTGAEVERTAVLSEDGVYRCRLTRNWFPADEPRLLRFVMLNPSKADASIDDLTIRRCVGFAVRGGYDGIEVVNLYAYRATDPDDMLQAADPVGPDNDEHIARVLSLANFEGLPVIAAWGGMARAERVREVLALPHATETLHCLALTKAGVPRHPSRLPYLPQMTSLQRLIGGES